MSLPFIWLTISILYAVISASWMVSRSVGQVRRAMRGVWIASLVLFAMLLGGTGGPFMITALAAVRPKPQPTTQPLFQGIEYTRDIRTVPRPIVIHVVRIDLDAPGLQFLVTPPDASHGGEVRAQTTSEFLERNEVQLAINGDGWSPWRDITMLDYYPHSGDPVDVMGVAASEGVIYSNSPYAQNTAFISAQNAVSFGLSAGPIYNALTGKGLIVENGVAGYYSQSFPGDMHPRTVLALDQTGRVMILIVVDGRQPGYSEGVTLSELAEIALQHGAYIALNLDGGGSSVLVMADGNGNPVLLSSPIHNHLPYRERPIANHLGIYALPLEAP